MTSESPLPEPTTTAGETKSGLWSSVSTKTKLIAGAVLLVLVVITYWILQRFLPQWWGVGMAHRINGSFSSGTSFGLLFGIIGVALPLILLMFAVFVYRKGPRHIYSIVLALIALALTVPNLLTLAVVASDGSGARAGEAALDYNGAGFRGATLIGAIIGLLIGLAVDFYVIGRRREKRKIAKA
ncbi:MAG: hypothetical protein QM658_02570 [Gordonia sp. (in: high G+C Gram-positive bacteria)]